MDFTLQNEGTIYILTPHSEAAQEWVDEYLPDDAMTWGTGIIVEHRYIETIATAIVADGLEIE